MRFIIISLPFCIAILLEYQLWKNYGQRIYDYSGNSHHGYNINCPFSDRGVYAKADCMMNYNTSLKYPNPVSVVFWSMSDTEYPNGPNPGRIFCRWRSSVGMILMHDKPNERVKFLHYRTNYSINYSSNNIWPINVWVFITLEINFKTFKVKLNGVDSFFYTDSIEFKEIIPAPVHHIGTDTVLGAGLGGFVWYTAIYDVINVDSQYLGLTSTKCFIGICSTCNPSFKVSSLGEGCGPNIVSNLTDSYGNPCPSGMGCKSSLVIKCNCPSGSCEFSSENVCSCIELSSGSKYQAACSCSSILGQGCCHDDCASCSIENECLTCKANSTFIDKGKCLCIDGYYKDISSSSLNCLKCLSECKTCTEQLTCTKCLENFTELKDGRCYCIDGYFSRVNLNSFTCIKCLLECKTCKDSLSCLTCQDPNTFLSDGRCLCINGYYPSLTDNILKECLKCDKSCSECEEAGKCLKCMSKYAEIKNGICFCNEGFWNDSSSTTSETCKFCSPPCQTCLNLDFCLSCQKENFRVVNGKCLCLDGYYQRFDSCVACKSPCKTCSSSSFCNSCLTENFILIDGECVCLEGFQLKDADCICPKGYYIEKNKCLKCLDNCETCQNAISCLTCKFPNMILENNTCKCEEGFYLIINESCSSCSKGCLNCKMIENKKKLECFDCFHGFSLNSGVCLTICDLNKNELQEDCLCPSGYIKINNTCKKEYLKLKIIIQQDNTLFLQFSEDLQQTLNSSLISIKTTIKDYSFKINMNSRNFSIISFDFKRTVPNNTSFKLIIHESIKSLKNKTLENHEFSLNFYEFEIIPKIFQEIIIKVETSGKICNIISFFFAFFSNPSAGWVLLNTLQMIYFLPLSKKPLTPVSSKFCKALGKMNSFNLPKLFFNPNCSDVPFDQARKIGILTTNVWINLGSELTVFFVMVFLVPFIFVLSRIGPEFISKKMKDLFKNYKFSFFIRFWLQSHLIFGVYSLINIESKTNQINVESAINKSFSFIFTAIFISTPALIFIVLWVDFDLIQSNDSRYEGKYGSLFQEFHYEKGLSFAIFYVLLGIRRIVFSFSQIYLSEVEEIQRALNFASSFGIFIYLVRYKPFKVKIVLISSIFIEFVLLLVFALILGRSFFGFLKDDFIFDMCFTSFLIGGLIFQYVICLIGLGIKIREILKRN